jgi:hypothetical protein
LEHGDLVAQSGDLSLLGGAGLKCSGKQSEHCDEDWAHFENDDDLTNDPTSVFSIRTEFSATDRRSKSELPTFANGCARTLPPATKTKST